MPSVRLFIVRHGERADEVLIKSFYEEQKRIWDAKNNEISFDAACEKGLISSPPKMERLDPLLTAQGHQQAHTSFSALLKSLDGRKVAIFSSPLRRAIGTALMAGTVKLEDSVTWPQLSTEEGIKITEDSIPVVVLNDLGDFASEANRRGGCDVLSEAGSIGCAAMPSNDESSTNPFMQALTRMPSHLAKYSLHSKTVRFWKCDTLDKDKFKPMTPPIDPSCKPFVQEEKAFLGHLSFDHRFKARMRAPRPPNPINAVDKAVKAAIARGCDTCIVVAHREAIRDMAELCGYQGTIKTPYCCIGSFNAVYNTEHPASFVQYQFSNVWEPQKFQLLPPKYMLPTPPPGDGTSSIVFLMPGRTTQVLCTVKSDLNVGKLSSQIWLTTRNEGHLSSSKCRSSYIELEIISGLGLWHASLDFLRGRKSNSRSAKFVNKHIKAISAERKGHCELFGWATWEHPNGQLQALEVKLKPHVRTENHSRAGLTFYYH